MLIGGGCCSLILVLDLHQVGWAATFPLHVQRCGMAIQGACDEKKWYHVRSAYRVGPSFPLIQPHVFI